MKVKDLMEVSKNNKIQFADKNGGRFYNYNLIKECDVVKIEAKRIQKQWNTVCR